MMLARTLLFTPGNLPRMMVDIDVLGADVVILDLEDAITPSQKDSARIMVKNFLKTTKSFISEIAVRINDITTEYFNRDLEVIVPVCSGYIMVPKINNADDIRFIDDAVAKKEVEYGLKPGSVKIIAILETASGIVNAYDIAAASKRIEAICIGGEDLAADLHARRSKRGHEILYSRERVVLCARAAGVQCFDTVFTDVDDIDGLIKDAEFARDLGYDGKCIISPRHIDYVNEVFSPTEEEVSYAQQVVMAMEEGAREGKGAVSLNGKMLDAPVLERARQTLRIVQLIKDRK